MSQLPGIYIVEYQGGTRGESSRRSKRARPYANQGQRFKALFRSCGFTAADVAKLLHVTPRTVHNWSCGAVPIPPMAVKLLRLHLRFDLPGKAWDGWHLSAGKLYTPEGLDLDPLEVSWWSLLVRQARCFRSAYRDLSHLRLAGRAAPVVAGTGRSTGPAGGGGVRAARHGRPAKPAGLDLSITHI